MLSSLKKNKQLFRRVRLSLLVLGIVLISLGVYVTWSHFISDAPVELRISTGRTAARRYQLAE